MDSLPTFPSPEPAAEQEKLGQQITLLAGQINAATFRLLQLIAEFDNCQGWSGGGTVRSCAHWLNWKCGIAMNSAREKVRVAHCLQDLPLISAAFAAGEISYSKVRAMTRAATPENEDYLLMIARHGTASHVEQAVSKYRRVQHRCSAEAGALVVKALEAVVEPRREEQRERLLLERECGRGEDQADPVASDGETQRENVSAETFSAEVDQADGGPHGDSPEQARADALVTLAEHFVASGESDEPLRDLTGSQRCQVMLHVDIHTLKKHSGPELTGLKHCNLDEDNWISAKTARRLACDAGLVTVLEDGAGNVLNIGRRSRTIPAPIRRALAIRDQTCRFPGCSQSRHLEGHHIQHWADGGETSLSNLAHLCRFHHGQLHRGCFSLRVEASEFSNSVPQLVFVSPGGKRIEHTLFPQFPPEVAANAARALEQQAPAVDAQTAVTRWQGEDCDYGMLIEGLLARDGEFGCLSTEQYPPPRHP